MTWFPHIRVVLVETSHPGNIGAAARAMKTMGLSQLTLVSPQNFPSEEATARAVNAADILAQAQVVHSLDEALQDCGCIIGMSAQLRHLPWPQLSPRECGAYAIQQSQNHTVALLFGRERDGLHNHELQRCHYHVQIPSNPECRALNLAAALQIIAYEIRMAGQESLLEATERVDWAASHEIEGLLEHFYTVAEQVEFLNTQKPKLLKERIRRIIMRAQLERAEVNILRGFLKNCADRIRYPSR